MKLYEISAEYNAFLEAIQDSDIPLDAIADTLESIQATLEDKADNIACVIKNMTAEIAAIKAEENALAERRKSKEKEVERITKYLSEELLRCGCTKIETPRNKITFRKSSKAAFDDEEAFIIWAYGNNPELLKFSDPTIDRIAVKKALAEGVEIKGAYIENRQNIQIK